jgi:DNA-binding transcriptional MerR regulator
MKNQKTKTDVLLKSYTAGQAAKAAEIPYHLVNYWAKTGVLVPSKQIARGSHTCRVYSFLDLVALRVAGRLRKAGIGTAEMRKVVQHLQKRGYGDPLIQAYLLVIDNKDVVVVEQDKLISALKNPGQIYLVFALGEAVNELMAVADAMVPPTRGKAKLAVA